MNFAQLIATFQAHQWLAAALIVVPYLRKLFSAGSKFPITLSPNVQPVVTAAFSMAIVVGSDLEAGTDLLSSIGFGVVAGVGMGFFDGLLVAIFGSAANAPSWAKSLVFLVDDLGGGASQAAKSVAKAAAVVLALAVLGASQQACSPAQMAEADKVEQTVLADIVAGKTLPQIESDVATLVAGQPGADVVVLVDDALTFLVDLGVVPASVLPYAKSLIAAEHPKAMAHKAPVLDGGAQ
jgi:hypothetical protein